MFIAPEETRTDRFVIRCFRIGEGVRVRPVVQESLDHLQEFMPWPDARQTDEQAEAVIRGFQAAYRTGKDFTMTVQTPDEAELIGGTGFHLRGLPPEHKTAEIGMWIAQKHAGAGLGRAVLKEMLRWGFEDWGWLRLTWHCDARNIASERCAQAAGMVLESTQQGAYDPVSKGRCDIRIYRMLRPEWDALQGA